MKPDVTIKYPNGNGSFEGDYISKLNIDQKSIYNLLSDKKSDFIIPDYQRPYAWTEEECKVLWEDIKMFSIPDDDAFKFDTDEEYFLGPIVTFKNEDGKLEVIDGQQRLTTIVLILRAFYKSFGSMKDENSTKIREMIANCIWKTDEFMKPDLSKLKVDSLVATDNDRSEFREIMDKGLAPEGSKSNYAANYRFFTQKIEEFLHDFPVYIPYLPARLMQNCILLPIEAESQDSALMIFSTLNNRGKPLSDADIFKSQMYKHYSVQGRKDEFVAKWKELEEGCGLAFAEVQNNPLDEIFTRYMYYMRSAKKIKLSTTEALRKFYGVDHYEILKRESTMGDLLKLMYFWKDVREESMDRFSDDVLSRFFVLDNAPNGMWTYILSVYFMKYSDADGKLDNDALLAFLDKIIAFIWTYAVTNPGVNALRTPVYAEMVNIYEGKPVEFADHLFDENLVRNHMRNYQFSNQRPITRSMLAWWAFRQPGQSTISTQVRFDIEHIYSRNRQEKDEGLKDPASLEMLGNKSLLETGINIRASDYKFKDKKLYYLGTSKSRRKQPTIISELIDLSDKTDFTEKDIHERNERIIDGLIDYLRENGLLKS